MQAVLEEAREGETPQEAESARSMQRALAVVSWVSGQLTVYSKQEDKLWSSYLK